MILCTCIPMCHTSLSMPYSVGKVYNNALIGEGHAVCHSLYVYVKTYSQQEWVPRALLRSSRGCSTLRDTARRLQLHRSAAGPLLCCDQPSQISKRSINSPVSCGTSFIWEVSPKFRWEIVFHGSRTPEISSITNQNSLLRNVWKSCETMARGIRALYFLMI